jgi:hypothetical protein
VGKFDLKFKNNLRLKIFYMILIKKMCVSITRAKIYKCREDFFYSNATTETGASIQITGSLNFNSLFARQNTARTLKESVV